MNSANLLDGLLEPLSRCLDGESARRLVEFRVAPEIQKRIEKLADAANEGELSAEDREEYEAVVEAAEFIGILKLRRGGIWERVVGIGAESRGRPNPC